MSTFTNDKMVKNIYCSDIEERMDCEGQCCVSCHEDSNEGYFPLIEIERDEDNHWNVPWRDDEKTAFLCCSIVNDLEYRKNNDYKNK